MHFLSAKKYLLTWHLSSILHPRARGQIALGRVWCWERFMRCNIRISIKLSTISRKMSIIWTEHFNRLIQNLNIKSFFAAEKDFGKNKNYSAYSCCQWVSVQYLLNIPVTAKYWLNGRKMGQIAALLSPGCQLVSISGQSSAVKRSIGFTIGFHNYGQGPSRAFSWLKVPTQ